MADITANYKVAHSKTYNMRVYDSKDQDIIEHMAKQPSAGGYLRRLVREDMERQKAQQKNSDSEE